MKDTREEWLALRDNPRRFPNDLDITIAGLAFGGVLVCFLAHFLMR